jgi:hypothetical protein
MASRDSFWLQHFRPERVVVAGSFAPNGGSAVDNTKNTGSGGSGTGIFSVTRSSAGKFVVLMNDVFNGIESVVPSVQITGQMPSGAAIAVTALTQTTTATSIELTYSVAGTPTDLAAAATTAIHFLAVLRNTSIL